METAFFEPGDYELVKQMKLAVKRKVAGFATGEQRSPVKGGGIQGANSWGRIGYGGPCPPSGTHRYFFRLYALDTMLDLKPGATKSQLLKAMEGHILAEGELMGRYQKR